MDFIGSIVNLVIVIGLCVAARDWIDGLRADVVETRDTVLALRKEVAEARELIATLGLSSEAEFQSIRDGIKWLARHQLTGDEVYSATAKALSDG